jgi:hypothetical protein
MGLAGPFSKREGVNNGYGLGCRSCRRRGFHTVPKDLEFPGREPSRRIGRS